MKKSFDKSLFLLIFANLLPIPLNHISISGIKPMDRNLIAFLFCIISFLLTKTRGRLLLFCLVLLMPEMATTRSRPSAVTMPPP